MANKHRNEVTVKLDGEEYVLRPTFDAIARIEDSCGIGILAIAEKIFQGDISILTTTRIIYFCLVKQDEFEDINEVGELVVKGRVMSFAPEIATLLTGIISGGKDSKGKKQTPKQEDNQEKITPSEK